MMYQHFDIYKFPTSLSHFRVNWQQHPTNGTPVDTYTTLDGVTCIRAEHFTDVLSIKSSDLVQDYEEVFLCVFPKLDQSHPDTQNLQECIHYVLQEFEVKKLIVKFENTDYGVIVPALSQWAMDNDFIFNIDNKVINIDRYRI